MTIEGRATQWTRFGDSGQSATFHFCPVCRSTVYWEPTGVPGFLSVAVGMFADPSFPPPHVSVYEERQYPWALAAGQSPLEHVFWRRRAGCSYSAASAASGARAASLR